jgi:hypothetical protein
MVASATLEVFMSPNEPTPLKAILDRICGEYLEMPGLRLTQRQAQRLWGLDEQTCSRILSLLLQDGFLRETYDGRFARTLDTPTRGAFALPAVPHERHAARRHAS